MEFNTQNRTWHLTFDGGSNGNPGPSAGAAILTSPDGSKFRASIFIAHATNNQAEYAGLICGLQLAKDSGAKILSIRGDSKLVINQVGGIWKVKDATMKLKVADAKDWIQHFHSVDLQWIPREENSEADAEVRRCLEASVPSIPAPSETIGSVGDDVSARYLTGKYAVLNRKADGQASFQDLTSIKVGGQDEFSRKKRDAILEALGGDADNAVLAIASALTRGKPNLAAHIIEKNREKLELTALRWVLRGLRPEHAGQKVLADLELSLNAMRGRGR